MQVGEEELTEYRSGHGCNTQRGHGCKTCNTQIWTGGDLKKGDRSYLFPFLLKIGEDQKKVFTSSDVQFTPLNLVKTKKKVHRVLRCPVFTVPLTGDIYQLIFQRGGDADPAAHSLSTPLSDVLLFWTGQSRIFIRFWASRLFLSFPVFYYFRI